MERFADIRLKLQGHVGSNVRGEVLLDGYPIQGSNLGTTLRYLVKGLRGFKGQVPFGVAELGDLLRQQGIASSKFPESIRPLLVGKTGRRSKKGGSGSTLLSLPQQTPQSSDQENDEEDDEVDAQAQNLGAHWTMGDRYDYHQHGSGIGILNQAMDHANRVTKTRHGML